MAESQTNKGQQHGTQGNQGNANKGQQQGQGHGQGQGMGGGVAQYVKDTAKQAQQGASGMMSAASEQAEHAASSVAGGMKTLAGTIREHAPDQGMLHSAADTVAGSLESGSRYLEQEGLSGMVEDMSGMIRRNPMPCMFACIGIGFLLGRMLTSSSSRSY
jgi:hypothetical protein